MPYTRIARQTRQALTTAHKILRLATPYFNGDQRWRARAMLAAIVTLNLATVYVLVLINDWNRVFYDALQDRNADVFWRELGRFAYLALAYIVVMVYKVYLTQLLEARWRAWMTHRALHHWTSHHRSYHLELLRFGASSDGAAHPAPTDNPDQRIHEDINLFTSYTVSLSMGLLNALVTLGSFVGILWALSGAFTVPVGQGEVVIPGFMVWAAVVYCVVGSALAHWIGRPLTRLNREQQRLEADFRHHLVRVREYSDAIALDRGEARERSGLSGRFGHVLANTLALLAAQKRLTWFTTGFGQAAVIFPFVVAAPRFFSGAIQLGELMQISSAFGRVQDSLSWLVDNYDRVAAWRATADRLTGFEESISAPAQCVYSLSATKNDSYSDPISIELNTIAHPDGTPMITGLHTQLLPGDRVQLRGTSGTGKSTVLRAMAGVWPWVQGQITWPAGQREQAVFVSQRPYFPEGSLREALHYPQTQLTWSDETLRQALTQAQLPGLLDALDTTDAWGRRLSGGEQQRLALARVLLRQPRWLFLDEATSALDADTERAVLAAVDAMVTQQQGAIVEIRHHAPVRVQATAHSGSPATPLPSHIWQLAAGQAGEPAHWALLGPVHSASHPLASP